jgi:cyclase
MINKYSKQRLIFALYFNDGHYCLSRNFSLQKVGDINWLLEKFHIAQVTDYIDELVILNVSELSSNSSIGVDLKNLLPNFFVPVSVGGLVNNKSKVKELFDLGADRIIFNSAILQQSELPAWTINRYGANAVVASLDFKKEEPSGIYKLYSKKVLGVNELSLNSTLDWIENLGIKEIIVGSVDHDGTGYGVDLGLYQFLEEKTKIKLVPSGGMDTNEQIIKGFELCQTEAIVVSHLFNFMGPQLSKTRIAALNAGINLAKWSI